MTANRHLVIGRRFRGPPESGNGGYTCGMLAAAARTPVEVQLVPEGSAAANPAFDVTPARLVAQGHAIAGTQFTYAVGRLALARMESVPLARAPVSPRELAEWIERWQQDGRDVGLLSAFTARSWSSTSRAAASSSCAAPLNNTTTRS